MWKIILFFCVLILSLMGLTELLHKIWMFMLKPKTKAEKYLVVLLKDKNAQQQLNYAQEHLRWTGEECAQGLIAVDCGLTKKVNISCNGDCRCCHNTKIYGYNEILDIIKRENVFNDAGSAELL